MTRLKRCLVNIFENSGCGFLVLDNPEWTRTGIALVTMGRVESGAMKSMFKSSRMESMDICRVWRWHKQEIRVADT